jgi:hypothetical protein
MIRRKPEEKESEEKSRAIGRGQARVVRLTDQCGGPPMVLDQDGIQMSLGAGEQNSKQS